MQRLFSRFAASYGNKVAVMWGDCPQADILDAWQAGLCGLSGEQIKAGLTRTLDAYPEWPPTLGQFKALCRIPTVPAAHRLYLVDRTPVEPIPAHLRARIDALVEQMRGGKKKPG
jgi:hypothetical protein